MALTLHLLLIIFALACFLVGALASIFGWNLGKFNYLAWGLFAWLLAISFAT